MKKALLSVILFFLISVSYVFCGGVEIGEFQPNQIQNCALWLDASDKSTMQFRQGTNYVSQWNDKSGNDKNATQSTEILQPFYLYNFQNNLNVVSFTLDYLNISSYNSPSNHTNFIVFKSTQQPIAQRLFFYPTIGEMYLRNLPDRFFIVNGGTEFGTSSYVHNATNLVTAIFNGSNSKIIIGESITTGNPGSSSVTGTFNVGGSPSLGLYGFIAELIIYNRVLSDSEISQIRNYLTTKWGI